MTKETTPKSETLEAGVQLYLLSALVESAETLTHLVDQIAKKATDIKKSESLGSRNLSFPINGHNSLCLVSVFFTATPSAVPTLEKDLRHDNQIIRFLVTTWNDDVNQPARSSRTRTTKSPEVSEKSEE